MARLFGPWVALVGAVALAVVSLVALGAPTPTLFGALIGAVVVALVLPRPPVLPSVVPRAAQAAIGVLVASEVDVAALGSLGWAWPAVLGVIVATLAASIGLGQLLRRDGVSATTATFASVAGGASAMTALARDAGADPRIVAVVQYVRVLVILVTLPIVVGQVFATDTATTAAPPLTSGLTVVNLGYVAIACTAGPLIGFLARLPSPALLGALVAGLALSVVPVFEQAAVPPLVQAAAFVVIGTQAGIGFTRETIRVLRTMVVTVLASVVVLLVFCGALAIPLATLTGTSRLDAYLATSPGGLPVVLATATETGGDITFISAVQLLRLLLVIVALPLVAAWVRRRHT
ncbi:AbrB family transcriptional regulator [Aeromicrobium sp. CF3.5]|uniref:AbrB family transcriptional regulator n=1 Tax=Aeromicrobium sp. CF3.5 TaxID=3373078 RepID=UPI003EE5419E